MPAINVLSRNAYDVHIKGLVSAFNANTLDASDGDVVDTKHLNYVISTLVWTLHTQKPSYQHANDVLGVLEAVKSEFARRQVAKYDDWDSPLQRLDGSVMPDKA